MFYELQHSFSDELFNVFYGKNFSYPPHLHNSFEYILCNDGELEVRIDQTLYLIRSGEGVLVFPNQVHEMKTEISSSHNLYIFSTQLVKSYASMVSGVVPVDNRLTPSVPLCESLTLLNKGDSSLLDIKASLYALCAEFNKEREYSCETRSKNELISKIFASLGGGSIKNGSLETLAHSLGYNYVYLSRLFKESVGISFGEYLNRCRISEAEYLLKTTAASVVQIAMDSGYDSLRSFNRNFKSITGLSPIEYRARALKNNC